MPNPVTFDTSLEEVDEILDDANLIDSNEVNSTSNRRNAPLKSLCPGIFNSGDIYRHYPEEKVFMLGEEGSGLTSRREIQDFHRIKQEHLSKNELFVDSTFSKPRSVRISKLSKTYIKDIEWKRPKELSDDPKFYIEGGSRFDIKQARFGDCWLLASISSLAMHLDVLNQVVPKEQSFEDKEYAGIFHFRFWQYGRWIDVVIDDFLPTKDGELVSAHSSTANEFWSPLLVKAYAKLYGSWNVIAGGRASEAMQDFTGGIIRMYKADESLDLFNILLKDQRQNAFMSCAMQETCESFGIFCRHAYSITKVCEFDNFRLLRLRNPWGNEQEWTGAWSDNSPEWKCIPESNKKTLGLKIDDDGEFWMSFEDFQGFFRDIEVCYLNPVSSTDTNSKKKWQTYAFEGKWVRGVTAGGDGTSLGTFHQNPQYFITVDSPGETSDQCTVIVALMQKHRRAKNEESPSLNFAIYPLDGNGDVPKPLTTDYFASNSRVGEDSSWTTQLPREFTSRIELSPGSYCIVPYTTKPHDEGEFLLRVFCDVPASMAEHDEEIGYGDEGTMVRDHGLSDEGEKSLSAVFKKVSQGKLEINWKQLQKMLRKDPREGWNYSLDFNENTCRNMVILMVELYTGKFGFEEYKALRMNIKKWKDVFNAYDADGLGYLRTSELKGALNSAGYKVNKRVLIELVHRNQENPGKITFCEFVICALELKTMIEKFQKVS